MDFRFFILSLIALSASAQPARFEIRDLTQRNLLAIVSDAPLEKMVAQCHLVRGWMELDPQALESGIKGELEFDTRACETGSGVRDIVLQEKVLDVKEHPLASVQVKKWVKETKGSLTEKSDTAFLAEASVSYRGKTTPLEVPLKLSYFVEGEKTRKRLPGNLLRISVQIELTLSTFGVTIPDELKQTLSNKVEVVFDAVGTSKLPSDKILLPEGPKPKERT
ncbi:MAG: hypothetical protein ACKN9V_01220 [Pseudomonadota bacterium]